VFLFREREKSRKHRLFDAFWGFAKTVGLTILGGLQKVPPTKITTTTTTAPSSNSYNNNNNNNDDAAADDEEDDDNNDNDNNDDSYPLSFPPPTPTGIAGVRSSTIYMLSPTHSVLRTSKLSLNNWFETFLYSPRLFPLLLV